MISATIFNVRLSPFSNRRQSNITLLSYLRYVYKYDTLRNPHILTFIIAIF